jgi:hypothetical protein
MIHQSNTVKMSADGVAQFTVTAARVIYQLEIAERFDSMLDFVLRDWIEAARMAWRIEGYYIKAQVDKIAAFLAGENKLLEVDAKSFAVVNDESNFNLSFDFWQGSNARAFCALRFRRTDLGIDLPGPLYKVLETQDGILVETQDGSLIEIR